jgi:hypothetical protein
MIECIDRRGLAGSMGGSAGSGDGRASVSAIDDDYITFGLQVGDG